MSRFAELIHDVNNDVPGARDALFAAAYGELRSLAHARLRDGGRNSVLGTTALVHESYIRFARGGTLRAADRRAFFAYASQVMRSVIIDMVRERQAERRGGDAERLTLTTQTAEGLSGDEPEVLRIHEALLALEDVEPRLARIVEMRYFGGYSEDEVCDALQLSGRQVRRDWAKARLMLKTMLKG